jgi:serine protease Do
VADPKSLSEVPATEKPWRAGTVSAERRAASVRWFVLAGMLLSVLGYPTVSGARPASTVTVSTDDGPTITDLLGRIGQGLRGSLVQVIAYRPTGPVPQNADGMAGISRIEPNRGTLWASGVVVDDQGHILTCAEAAQPDDSLEIRTWDGLRIGARFLAQDAAVGVTLIQARERAGLVPTRAPNAAECQKGDWLLVLSFAARNAHPGIRLASMAGTASGPAGPAAYMRLALPDCRGTCGGAVVDDSGRLRGILVDTRTERERSDGTPGGETALELLDCDQAWALNALLLDSLTTRLEARSLHRSGFLGVQAELGEAAVATPGGSSDPADPPLVVVRVVPGSPAEMAGILPQDQILRIEGQKLQKVSQISDAVSARAPGSEIRITLLRKGVPVTLTARVGDRSALDWLVREDQMNQVRQRRLLRAIQGLQTRLRALDQQRSRLR